MRAPNIAALSGLTILCVALLGGCGGGGGSASNDTAPTDTSTEAERTLGVDHLPPDGVVTAAGALNSDDMPPASSATPDKEELPPV